MSLLTTKVTPTKTLQNLLDDTNTHYSIIGKPDDIVAVVPNDHINYTAYKEAINRVDPWLISGTSPTMNRKEITCTHH